MLRKIESMSLINVSLFLYRNYKMLLAYAVSHKLEILKLDTLYCCQFSTINDVKKKQYIKE